LRELASEQGALSGDLNVINVVAGVTLYACRFAAISASFACRVAWQALARFQEEAIDARDTRRR
jgi:hypothetical protein